MLEITHLRLVKQRANFGLAFAAHARHNLGRGDANERNVELACNEIFEDFELNGEGGLNERALFTLTIRFERTKSEDERAEEAYTRQWKHIGTCDGVRQQRFAAAGRSVQQNAARWFDALREVDGWVRGWMRCRCGVGGYQ